MTLSRAAATKMSVEAAVSSELDGVVRLKEEDGAALKGFLS